MWIALRLALRPWRLAPLSQAVAASSSGFLVAVVALLWGFCSALGPIRGALEQREFHFFYVNQEVSGGTSGELKKLEEEVTRHAFQNKGLKVAYVSPAQVLSNLKAKSPEIATEIESLGEEGKSLVPAYFSIEGLMSEEQLKTLGAIPGIDSVDSSEDAQKPFISALRTLEWIGRGLALGMVFVMTVTFFYLSKGNGDFFQGSMEQFRLLGASPVQRILPQVISVGGAGLLAGTTGFIILRLVEPRVLEHLKELSPLLSSLHWPGLFWPLELIGLVLASVAFSVGVSFLSNLRRI